MTNAEARAAIPADATWSSSFGNPGEGGFTEYFRQADGTRWVLANGPWNAIEPFNWTVQNMGPE